MRILAIQQLLIYRTGIAPPSPPAFEYFWFQQSRWTNGDEHRNSISY
jgi:hypothetical protein